MVKQIQLLDESGQSMVDFVILLPVLLGLVTLVYRMNLAIQESIVNQKYARAHMLGLQRNSAIYPRLSIRSDLAKEQTNLLVVGVSDNIIESDSDALVESPKVQISRNGNRRTGGRETSMVRVRTTVGMCTPSSFLLTQAGPALIDSVPKPNEWSKVSRMCEGRYP